MKNLKRWAFPASIVAAIVGALLYLPQTMEIALVEAQSEIDFSVLHPNTPGCLITGPDGTVLGTANIKVIPKGTLITRACFESKKP